MRSILRLFLATFALLVCESSLLALSPTVYLKFDGDLTDSSTAGIITSITPNGFTPTFTTDRNGVANKALVMPGSASLQLVAASLPTDSNTALGLRGGSGGSPFTLAAWIYVNSVSVVSGYNVVFGNLGSGTGTLHAGLLNANAHFGFDGNDATGSVVTFDNAKWYHIAFVYDGSNQRIYINGIPEITRTATNTLKASNLLIGNWNAVTNAVNDFIGRLDDVVVYNAALSIGQVQALYNGVDPNALPATFSANRLPGPYGSPGFWGVREIKSYSGINYNSLVNVDRILNGYAVTPSGTSKDYNAPVVNFTDPDIAANLGYFGNEANFATNTSGNDDNFCVLAKGTIRIATENDYTFGFCSDEGSRLRIQGATFTSGTAIGTGNQANPVVQGDAIYYTSNTTNSTTMGVTHLKPGDYNIEYTYWENNGGAACEVWAAPGPKTSVDSTFQLIGNTAAGGLPLVRDLDTFPQVLSFTGNGSSAVVVNDGSPANFTLAWQTNSITSSVTISPDLGIGALPTSGSATIASPTQTTTYTITATTGTDVATQTLTVYVNSQPVITSFSANPADAVIGSNVTLSWGTVGATTLTLQPGNIDVTGLTSKVVTLSATTTYTLVATNNYGTVQQSVNVIGGTLPVINSFTVSDPNPLYGAQTSLNWNVTNADSLSINQGVGPVSGATGSATIVALLSTTYTLTATNAYGTSTASVTLNIPTPIGVTSAGFTAKKIVSSVAFPFPGQDYLQSAISLVGGQNVQSQTTQAGYTTVNFWDGSTDGDFTTGNNSFPGGSIGNNTAVLITATLLVNSPGSYTFAVNCAGGCRLRINGNDVIVDDGTHYPGDDTGTVTLSTQSVQLELLYYNYTAGAEVELSWIRPNLTWQQLSTITAAPTIVQNQLMISEFMADNNSTLYDEDGAASDWIEIWNSTTSPINLSGYYLTNKSSSPAKWALPAWTLNPNQYLIVFASSKNRYPAQAVSGVDNPGTAAQPHLHTNFGLSKSGGYVALTKGDGMGGYVAVSSFSGFPAQLTDVSYGSSGGPGYIGFMNVPTPGGPNAATTSGFVQDVIFDHLRGRYSAAFSLGLSTATPGAVIKYTRDGSTPGWNNGIIYTGPIAVSATTVVRAIALEPGWTSSNVETNSFLFINDIVTQTSSTATALGFPASSVNGQVFRYGMTLANVTSAGGTLTSLKNALTAMPTVCMTTDIGNLVDPTYGIYTNPSRHDKFFERPVSMEYINVGGTSEFQIDCGARIRGGYSRSTSNPKHAFHMYFRNSLGYGGKLNYPIFGTAGASIFQQIDMRCEENYSWSFGNDPLNLLVREEWSRVSQGDLGEPQSRTGYFHLYINGIYWGVYNWEERTESSYGATYFGGNSDNFDVPKCAGSSDGYNTEMTNGSFTAWYSLISNAQSIKNATSEATRTALYMKLRGLNPDGTPNATYPVLLDVDNLIDYMLVFFFDGSFDSPMSTFLSDASNNWFAVRDRTGTRGFAFFEHDQEHGFDTNGRGFNDSYNRVGPWGGSGNNVWGQTQYGDRETLLYTKSNPQYLHEFLSFSAEYRQRFADRVERAFFNGGALTTANALARFENLAAQVDTIIHAEAARWGSTSLNRTSWLSAKAKGETFINSGGAPYPGQTTFPTEPRSQVVIQELQGYADGGAKPLFSTFLAPTISGGFGGNVLPPYNFSLTNPNSSGTIYYTTNGTDPRPIGGGAPLAGALTGTSPISVTLNNSAVVIARVYNSSSQTWSPSIQPQFIAGVPASQSNLVISKIHYHPATSTGLEEFVELLNIGATNIDLTNVQFTLGIQFSFPLGYLLAPNARVLIVRDMNAFTTAYPSVPAAQIAGVFANGTSLNNGGERLQLLGTGGAVIRDFSYSNVAPWPTSPDGLGPALVLINPQKNPDESIGTNWRESAVYGGSPGASDAVTYAQWAALNGVTDPTGAASDNGFGYPNLIAYALGLNPSIPSPLPVVQGSQNYVVNGNAGNYLTIQFTKPIGTDDIAYTVEASSGLTGAWTPGVLVSGPVNNGNSTETYVYRHPVPDAGQPQQYLRVRVTQSP